MKMETLVRLQENEKKGERVKREWDFSSVITMSRLSELSYCFQNGVECCWKSDKNRGRLRTVCSNSFYSVFVILSLLIVSSLFIEGVQSSEDWTAMCPSKCKCTWVSGRKTAECVNAGFNRIPNGLSPEVQVLDLSHNSISQLTKDAFTSMGLDNLQKVFLKNCGIEKVDKDAFRDLKIMIELDLTGNKIESLYMETFASNERLRELRLKENPLSVLKGTQFPPLLHLKLLDLSNCQLEQFSKKTFDKLAVLETLDLTGNKLQYISEDILTPLKKLKSLSLQNNPWKCDCRLKSFRDWVMAQKLYQVTTCAEPGHLANFQWIHLQSKDFACKPEIVALQIGGQATEASIAYADVGSDITLACFVRANPPPDVKWVRDGQVLTNSSRNQGKIYLLHISGEYERWINLTIVKSDVDDAGEYTCVGNNAGGFVEKNLTLNFQDVPPIGTGVGPGIGLGSGAYRDQSWLWILIGVLGSLVILTTVIMIVCFCTRKRRVKTARAQDLKNEAKNMNGSVAGYTECPTQNSKAEVPKQNVITLTPENGSGIGPNNKTLVGGMSVVAIRRGRLDGYEGLPQTEFELSDLPSMSQHHHPHPHPHQLSYCPDPASYVPQTQASYDEMNRVLALGGSIIPIHSFSSPMGPQQFDQEHHGVGGGGIDGTTTPLLGQTSSPYAMPTTDVAASDYPDLLDIPHRSQESPAGSSASTVPDSTRLIMPQQLNPATLAYDTSTPGRNPTILYGHHPHMMARPNSPYAASISSFTSEPPQVTVIVPPANRPGYVTLRRPRVPSWSPASPYNVPPSTTPLLSPGSMKYDRQEHIGPRTTDRPDMLGPRTTADGSSRLSLNKIGDGTGTLTPSSARSPTVRQTPLSHHSPAVLFNFAPIQEIDPSTNSNIEQSLSTLPRSWKPGPNAIGDTSISSENSIIIPNTPGSHSTTGKKIPPRPPPKPNKKPNPNSSEATKSVQTTTTAPTTTVAVTTTGTSTTTTAKTSSTGQEGDDGTEV